MGEELYTFTRLVDAPAIHEFADGDGAVGIDAALIDPGLDSVEVYGGEVGSESNSVVLWLASSSRHLLI